MVSASEGPNKTEHCMLCGVPLEYLKQGQVLTCTFCGKKERGYVRCPNMHYVCETCHNKDAIAVIEDIAFNTQSKDPIEISELMMSHPCLPMLGCHHAFIAGGAMMAALKNESSKGITNEDIREVFERTKKQAHGGYCGLTGICGIAPAIGACFAILTDSKCGKNVEQKITMEAVAEVSKAITDLTGPSCCKAYVRSSLTMAMDFLKKRFNIVLPVKDFSMLCRYTNKHPHGCRESKCPYFKYAEK